MSEWKNRTWADMFKVTFLWFQWKALNPDDMFCKIGIYFDNDIYNPVCAFFICLQTLMSVWVHLACTVPVLTNSTRINATVNQDLQEYIVKQVMYKFFKIWIIHVISIIFHALFIHMCSAQILEPIQVDKRWNELISHI